MSIATIVHKYAFGLKADVSRNVSFLSDGRVVYPVGNTIVMYTPTREDDEMSNTQTFPPDRTVQDVGEGITAMATCSRYVAIAERGEPPTVQLYDIIHTHNKKRKKLVGMEQKAKEFVSLAFDKDSRHMVTLGGAPDYVLAFWVLDRERMPLVQQKVCSVAGETATMVSFHPTRPDTICVTGGGGLVRLFKVVHESGQLKHVGPSRVEGESTAEPVNYTCHAWVSDDVLVLGTDSGQLALVHGFELTHDQLDFDPSHKSDTSAISSIVSFSKGYAIGTETLVRIYGRIDGEGADDDGTHYQEVATIPLPNSEAHINHVTLGGTTPETDLVVSTNQSELYICRDFQVGAFREVEGGTQLKFEILAQKFHRAAITGLDTCIRKSLVVTCSLDRSVRVWNYVDNVCELEKTFQEEAYSIALHPAGLQVLVGFSDKLRMMNLLVDDIVTVKEFPQCRMCREVRFSNGGQYFAAVNVNLIQLYNTYTYDPMPTLNRGHSGKVRSIFWSLDDSKIISAGHEGAIYEWDLYQGGKRTDMNVDKKCHYTSVVRTNDGRTIFAVGDDKKLKMIDTDDTDNPNELPTGKTSTIYTQVALSRNNRMMFVGTIDGTIRSIKYPVFVTAATPGGEYLEMVFHNTAVTRLAISHDEKWLFSAGEDGALFIASVRDTSRDLSLKEMDVPFSEEILITKPVLKRMDEAYHALQHTLENERSSGQFAATNAKQEAAALEVQLKAEHQSIHDNLRSENYNLRIEKEHLTAMFEAEIEKIKATNKRGAEIERRENESLTLSNHQKHLAMEKEMEEEALAWDREKEMMEQEFADSKRELLEKHEAAIREKNNDLQKLEGAILHARREYEETKRQIEEDADEEIQDRVEHYQGMIDDRDAAMLKLKGQVGIMRKEFKQLKKANADQGEKTKAADNKVNSLKTEISKKLEAIQALNSEILDRDTTIKQKEDTIHDLKKQNQDLEKHKFVLEFRNKELTQQLEPRDDQINDQLRRINQMDTELEKFYKNNVTLKIAVENLELKVKSLEKDILARRSKINDSNAIIKRWQTDLDECVQHIQDPVILKEFVKQLYQKHVTLQVQDVTLDPSVQRENFRQREFLERSVVSLKRKLAKDAHIHHSDNASIMAENVALIKEINALRKDIKALKLEKRNLEAMRNIPARRPARSRPSRPGSWESLPSAVVAEMESNKVEIARLHAILADYGEDGRALIQSADASMRPVSEPPVPPMTLPPLAGATAARPVSHGSSRGVLSNRSETGGRSRASTARSSRDGRSMIL